MKRTKKEKGKPVKWIHPNNVCIEGTRIMKIGRDSNWNAAAFSLQYLDYGDSGSIMFKVPGLDDLGNQTCDWTQQFFIGFSDGAHNPDYQKNVIGVRIQQGPKETEPSMSLEVYQGCGQISKSNPVLPGDSVNVSIVRVDKVDKEGNLTGEFFIEWEVKWYNSNESRDIIFKGKICDSALHAPLVAKIALYNGPKVVKDVELFGDWKIDANCKRVPFCYNEN